MKKLGLALLIFVILMPLIAAAAVICILNWPTLVINPGNFERAAKYAKAVGVDVRWNGAGTSSVSHGFLDKTVTVSLLGLCVKMLPALESACVDSFETSFRYRFSQIIPDLVGIGPVTLSGARIRYHLVPSTEDATQKPLALPRIELPGFLHQTSFFPIALDVTEAKIAAGGVEIEGTLSLAATPDDRGALDRISVVAKVKDPSAGRAVDADLTLSSSAHFREDVWQLQGTVQASLSKTERLGLKADFKRNMGTPLDHQIDLSYEKGKLRGEFALRGGLKDDAFTTDLTGSLVNVSREVPRAQLSGCRLAFSPQGALGSRGELKVNCPMTLTLMKLAMPSDLDSIYHPAQQVSLTLSGTIESPFPPDLAERVQGNARLVVRSSKSELVTTGGSIATTFSGVPEDFPKGWNISSNLDVDFTIKEFSRIVQILRKTRYPVPAPFEVLDGTLEFSLEGTLRPLEGMSRIPVSVKTRLRSPKQSIDIDSTGEGTFTIVAGRLIGANLELDVMLNDVQLSLPDVSLAGIPRLVPDARIILAKKAKDVARKGDFQLTYRLNVKTAEGKPVRIWSNLSPESIPIELDVNLDDKRVAGDIKVTHFPLELFRRRADIESFSLHLREPTDQSEIDGSVKVIYPDYDVFIRLSGMVKQPMIALESDPPLSRENIIAVLLYGEPYDDLDSDSAGSVSNMNRAMGSRALTLYSMFLLASTPIQSVGYNPDTKMFSAKIKLGKKMSLNVGASGSEQEVGVKRRLGKGWSVSTSFENPTNNQPAQGTALIEWNKRY